jgi:hypothetical protein
MLERTHQFLTEKSRADVEAAAERFFPALGYRLRVEAPRADAAARALAFARGRRFASLYDASLRACRAEVAVEAAEGARPPTAVHVRHRVATFGRLVVAEDAALLDAESRAFERFLERGDVDTAALIEAAMRTSERAAAWKIAAAIALGAAAFGAAWVLLRR